MITVSVVDDECLIKEGFFEAVSKGMRKDLTQSNNFSI